MTNLNPNGTGFMLPNQYTNADKSFVPPPPSVTGPSVSDTPEGYSVDLEQPPQNRPQIIDLEKVLGKSYAGCYWWRIVLNFNGYGFKQVGKYSRVNGMRADGTLQSDMPWILCLPSLATNQTPASPPAAIYDRITADVFAGTLVIAGDTPLAADLFRETSVTNPVIIAVAGYVPPAGVSGINAIKTILINGTSYLAICFQTSGGGNTIQILSDLANPPTSSTIPVGANPTYDVIQTAIDGNALLIYNNDGTGNGQIVAIRADVGAGAVALSAPRCKIPAGGYGVGLSEAEDNDPMAYWVVPIETGILAINGAAGTTSKGKLIKTDARGYLPVNVDVPLRWVTWASRVRGGIVVCDTRDHWYLNKNNPRGKWRRMPVFDEFPPHSDVVYQCAGHTEKNGKFLMEVNEIGVTLSVSNTVAYSVEFDFDRWCVNKLETPYTGAAVNTFTSKGMIRGPWSPYTEYKQARRETGWVRQQIFSLGTDLYGQRKTVGASAGTGAEYEGFGSLTLPVMDIDGLEDCAKTFTAISGPKSGAVATGGTGAYVLIEELLSGRTGAGPNGQGAVFYGTEPVERVQKRLYKTVSWTYQIQPRFTLVRQSGGTDPTRLTPNAFNNQIFMEGIAVKDPITAPVANILKAMDRQRVEPTP